LKDYEIGERGPAEEEPFPQLDIAPDLDGTLFCFSHFDSLLQMITLTRQVDSWLEHVEFHSLFQCLSDEEVLQVFAATVLERRIVFIAEELSTLSQVLHAVAALLFPFIWQHTFISIVPKVLLDVYLAPTPYLLGIQKNLLHLLTEHTDLLIVDLTSQSECKFISR
ncbi:DENN domain-containing protein 2D, partial [Silurus asotus]